MVYENNFAVLDDRAIFDPALRIFVTLGRMHWEEEGHQVVHISHDPGMRPEVLIRATEWEEADRAGDEEKKSKLGSRGFSEQIYGFFEFTLRKATEDETLVWEFLGPDEEFRRANLGSVMRQNLYECPDRKAFLLYVFRNLLLIPKLRRWSFLGYKKAQIRISASKFAHLTGRSVEDVQNEAILAEREVEAVQ